MLEAVKKYQAGNGPLAKLSTETEAQNLDRIKNYYKQAWEATFFGKVNSYLGGNVFPKIKVTPNGTGNIINHIPFDKTGGFENQTLDYFILTTRQGFTSDSFDPLFVLFYNYLKSNNASLGLSAYGAPQVRDVTSSTSNFQVIHLESPK